jgi:hypothetical protein
MACSQDSPGSALAQEFSYDLGDAATSSATPGDKDATPMDVAGAENEEAPVGLAPVA